MKLPSPLSGICRGHRWERPASMTKRLGTTPHAQDGITPQQEWCEDVCQETYDVGSEEHEECLAFCRED